LAVKLKIRQVVPEEYMVAAFLQAEVDSPRFSQLILDQLPQSGQPRSIIDTPDLANAAENGFRARLLGYRGYKLNVGLFAGFPSDAEWKTVTVDLVDLNKLKVINQEPWTGFAGGSRLAPDAARWLCSSSPSHTVMQNISAVVKQVDAGMAVHDLVLVGSALNDSFVIMEGHVRIMAALVRNRKIELEAVLGVSSGMLNWVFY
jgi:hypothetical protein